MASFSCATGQASSKARERDSSWNAFAWSCNRTFALTGLELGTERLALADGRIEEVLKLVQRLEQLPAISRLTEALIP